VHGKELPARGDVLEAERMLTTFQSPPSGCSVWEMPVLLPPLVSLGAAPEAATMVACTMQLQAAGLVCLPSNLVFAAHALGSVASKQPQPLKACRGV
jgi:hypothetical protein